MFGAVIDEPSVRCIVSQLAFADGMAVVTGKMTADEKQAFLATIENGSPFKRWRTPTGILKKCVELKLGCLHIDVSHTNFIAIMVNHTNACFIMRNIKSNESFRDSHLGYHRLGSY